MESVNYISLAEAAERCEYSQEYLSLRARQGKLKAVKQGRNWVTTYEWLLDYLKQVDQVKQELKEVTASPSVATTSSLAQSVAKVDAIAPKRETIVEHHPVKGRVEAWLDEPVVQNQPIKEAIKSVENVAPVREETAYLNESEQLADALLATETAEPALPVKAAVIKPSVAATIAEQPRTTAQTPVTQPVAAKATHSEEDIFQQVLQRSQAHQDFWPETSTPKPVASKVVQPTSDRPIKSLNAAVKKEKSPSGHGSHSMKWQPILVGALVMALAIEVGVLVRPIGMAAQDGPLKDISTKMSVGLAVLTGNPPALTWKAGQDQPVVAKDTAGTVAGAQTERESYTAAQKIAAGFLMFVDPGTDGTHSSLGNWLMDTFNLPDNK